MPKSGMLISMARRIFLFKRRLPNRVQAWNPEGRTPFESYVWGPRLCSRFSPMIALGLSAPPGTFGSGTGNPSLGIGTLEAC